MRVPSIETIHNSRVARKIANTHDYFLSEVDPLISDCIAHLLVSQPRDVPKAVLEYFEHKKAGRSGTDVTSEIVKRPRKEQKIYLATAIGPVIAKLVNRIAVTRPENILDFMCSEMAVIIEEGPTELLEPPNLPTEQQGPEEVRESKSRARLEEARSLAESVSGPIPEPVSSARSKLDDARALASSISSTSLKQRPESAPITTLASNVKVSDISDLRRPGTASTSVVGSSSNDDDALLTATAAAPVPTSAPTPTPTPAPASASAPASATASAPMKSIQIALLGIGGAGKTSWINTLQGDFDSRIRPSNGFRPITTMLGESTQIKFYDLGGGDRIRNIWSQYYHDVHAVIYVFDAAADAATMEKAVQVFKTTMSSELLRDKPLLLVANKQDVAGAMTVDALFQLLELGEAMGEGVRGVECCSLIPQSQSPRNSENEFDPSSFRPDDRVEGGVEWLLNTAQERFEQLDARVQHDIVIKSKEEAMKRLERERKVLRNKIACAFCNVIDPELLPPQTPSTPEDVFSEDEGLTFLAGELGIDVVDLPETARQVAALVGYQRLALQMIGALNVPISKKKTPMKWEDILVLIADLRSELGLSS